MQQRNCTLLLGSGRRVRKGFTQDLNRGWEDKGYTFSGSPVRSGDGSQIQPKMPSQEAVNQGLSLSSVCLLALSLFFSIPLKG